MASRLSPSQQAAVEELRGLLQSSGLSQPDDSLLTSLLEIESWNVQRAARMVQDDHAAERRRSGADDEEIARSFATRPSESFSVDDSAIRRSTSSRSDRHDYGFGTSSRTPAGAGLRGDRGPLSRPPGGPSISAIIWSAITFPFTLAQSILLFIARLLRLRTIFPGLFGPPSGDARSRRLGATDPRICAERYIRELEEETGGISGSLSANSRSAGTGTGAGDDDASLATDTDTLIASRPRLPHFHVGGYSDALRVTKEEIKVMMVILTSREHGDVEYFRKSVLVDQELVSLLSRPEFVVWGGDVKEREAYQVATQLEATTYPFIAFIALQPPRGSRRHGVGGSSSSASASPRLAVLSRLEGSPLSATSASTIISHVTDVLLPRTQTHLDRLRSEKRRRELERELKAEQDRAYLEASRRDAERVAKKREEERQRALEVERKRQEEAHKHLFEQQRRQWITWAKTQLVPREPSPGESDTIRLAFRLPNGRNLSRHFRKTDALEAAFAYVETAAAATDSDDDGSRQTDPPAGYQHEFKFSLVLGYPRQRLGTDKLRTSPTLGEIQGLGSSANLIVEGKVGSDAAAGDESSDGESEDE